MDPFSVMAILCRGIKVSYRTELAKLHVDKIGIKGKVPTEFPLHKECIRALKKYIQMIEEAI